MSQRNPPAPPQGREQKSKLGSIDEANNNTHRLFRKCLGVSSCRRREEVLEQIAIKWWSMGLYQSPAHALTALLCTSIQKAGELTRRWR